MSDLLSAADITALRRKWIYDEVDFHREWGSAPKVSTIAAAGASSVALKALGTGTIARGTSFSITTAGISQRYTVKTDVTIAANTATVDLTSLLTQAVAVDDLVTVEAIHPSVYNKSYTRELFSDTDLQDFASQAERRYAKRIAQSDIPDQTRFKAIELFALQEQARTGSGFLQALVQSLPQDQVETQQKVMQERITRLENDLATDVHGFRTCEVYR